jgi:hypothetical protein
VDVVVAGIAAATWNTRVALIRKIPEEFGKAQHQAVYAAVARAVYVSELAPVFAYVHWRDEYELEPIERAYQSAFVLTNGFKAVDPIILTEAMVAEPSTVRIFRLLLAFTIKEFAAATVAVAESMGASPVSDSTIKTMEAGRGGNADVAQVLAATVDQAMHGMLFSKASGSLRTKIEKPDTVEGWATVRRYATENVPLPIFLHQRHYGGAFRQLLDATSGKRGDLLEDAVEELLADNVHAPNPRGDDGRGAVRRPAARRSRPNVGFRLARRRPAAPAACAAAA